MSDNQQQNQNQVNTGDDIPEGKTMKFKYKRSTVYSLLLRSAEYNLGDIDAFFELAKKARRSEQKNLEQIAAISGENVSDEDRWGDDVPQLKEFAWLYSEFAIIGLWRCIELYRKSAMRSALGKDAAERAYRHKQFQNDLLSLRIKEKKIRCAQSVNELRCLNNAIKHERRVNGELAEFRRWKKKKRNQNSKLAKRLRWRSKKDDELGDLKDHYLRLRPLAERYLEDLTKRLKKAKNLNPSPSSQVSKT